MADLAGALAAVSLFPLFALVPGYSAAWVLDLFGFRRRTESFRIGLSIPLSISISPIAAFLAARFGPAIAVWVLFAISWGYFLRITWPRLRRIPNPLADGDPSGTGSERSSGPRPESALASGCSNSFSRPMFSATVAAILIGWTALAVFSLVDLQFSGKDYFPVTAFDFAVRTEFIRAIARGIPPANPFFFPHHAVGMRYHYLWLVVCGLVSQPGGALVGPRAAWIGGVVWCGFGIMAITALYFRLFAYRGPDSFRRRALTGILLLAVTGLDILPTLLLWALQLSGMHGGVLPSMEWWNEQVDGFVYTALWEAHHLCGLIACLMSFLLLWEAARRASIGERVKYSAMAGIALATAGGASIYVGGVFAVFLAVWTSIAILKRWWREAANLAGAGFLAIVLFLPYGRTLAGAASGGPPIVFQVRRFYPADVALRGVMHGPWARPLVDGLMLPWNYLFELGFFLCAALIWWKKRRASGRALSREEMATALMVLISMLICTFLRSSLIGNNDLGWRGFLFAQFGMLLWGVDVFADRQFVRRAVREVLLALLVLGLAGTAYDTAILRLYPVLADCGITYPVPWMAPDRQLGRRNYAAREAYEWMARATRPSAIVQFNPHVRVQDTSAFLYANRQIMAGNESCLSGFGGDPALCPAVIAKLNEIYPRSGQAASTFEDVCRSLPIDILVAKDTDPAWADPRSWVWTQTPAFANDYLRLFRCGGVSADGPSVQGDPVASRGTAGG